MSVKAHRFHDHEQPCFPGCPAWGDDLPMTRSRLVRTASDLRSEHGENPEYDRALVELVNDLLGLSSDNRAETEQALGIVKVNEDRLMLVCRICGEAFDTIETAGGHDQIGAPCATIPGQSDEGGFDVVPESQAL